MITEHGVNLSEVLGKTQPSKCRFRTDIIDLKRDRYRLLVFYRSQGLPFRVFQRLELTLLCAKTSARWPNLLRIRQASILSREQRFRVQILSLHRHARLLNRRGIIDQFLANSHWTLSRTLGCQVLDIIILFEI